MNFELILFLAGCFAGFSSIVYFLFIRNARPLTKEEMKTRKTANKEFMTTTDKIVLEIL
ncbi:MULTISPECIES: hypothetical protein [unclassified Sulfurimonas]|uniref:hypothetical protein n=1 Tax=unclassified Sulfurimonas TaxID=2623549 RepID=UPI0025D53975|nr:MULTISPECIES: hypothetical protein [unclassified Sulfurimonas]